MTDDNRHGENGVVPQRNSRFFKHGNNWFFTTRECSIIGPYQDFNDAFYGCRKFITQIKAISEFHGKERECV